MTFHIIGHTAPPPTLLWEVDTTIIVIYGDADYVVVYLSDDGPMAVWIRQCFWSIHY